MKELIHSFDRSMTEKIVSWFGPSLHPFFSFVTFLGDPFVTVAIGSIIAVVGLINSRLALVYAGLAVPASLIIGFLLKLLFERARPMTDYASGMWLHTFSFPSGHSTGAVVAYGLLAYIAFHSLPAPWNIFGAVLLIILALAVGISRIYLGAHFPSDVVAGWLLGSIVLAVVIFVVRPLG